MLVKKIDQWSQTYAEFGVIIDECNSLLVNYPNFKISFIMRQANFVAHSLADIWFQ
jgi:hypothetical protein